MPTRRGVLIGLACAAMPLRVSAQRGDLIDADEARRLSQAGELIIVDVRTPTEWAQTGIAQGATPIAMQDPQIGAKLDAATGGDRSAPIALICATGARSGHVAEAMAQSGYTNVYSIGEGMHGSAAGPGWLRRGLPVEQAK